MKKIFVIAVLMALSIPAYADYDAWVTADNLNIRTCPATSCGIVGLLTYREKVTVMEEKDGWARITKYYDAACTDGANRYVNNWNNECTTRNGIINGFFAEWVSAEYLSAIRPDGDFREMRGWAKSYTHRNKHIYFTYCGRMHSSNKVYLNAPTGEVVR